MTNGLILDEDSASPEYCNPPEQRCCICWNPYYGSFAFGVARDLVPDREFPEYPPRAICGICDFRYSTDQKTQILDIQDMFRRGELPATDWPGC